MSHTGLTHMDQMSHAGQMCGSNVLCWTDTFGSKVPCWKYTSVKCLYRQTSVGQMLIAGQTEMGQMSHTGRGRRLKTFHETCWDDFRWWTWSSCRSRNRHGHILIHLLAPTSSCLATPADKSIQDRPRQEQEGKTGGGATCPINPEDRDKDRICAQFTLKCAKFCLLWNLFHWKFCSDGTEPTELNHCKANTWT